MATKAQIDAFLSSPHIAVAGYSRSPKKFGSMVFRILKEKGHDVYAVNPAGGETPQGQTVYPDVMALPEKVKALLVVTKPDVAPGLVKQALEKGITHIWIQQMTGNKEVKEMLDASPVEQVYGHCILLHAQPAGIHKAHRWILNVFGRLPK